MLFVIRDHVGATPLANLAQTLQSDLTKIWDSLSKPEGLADRLLTDYFDLSFTGLPHKVLLPEKFQTEVAELRKRFVDRERDDFVFKPAYHKRIPADGVSHYMETIWVCSVTTLSLYTMPSGTRLISMYIRNKYKQTKISTFQLNKNFSPSSVATRLPRLR